MKTGKIIFLDVPKSLSEEMKALAYNTDEYAERFTVDPSIPLPVELPEEDDAVDAKILADKLSWEMIISGMIQVISGAAKSETIEGVKPHWLNYYRHFILVLKPSIYNEFTGAAIIKARNKDFGAALEIIESLEGLFPFSPEVLLNKALIHEDEAADLEKKGCEVEAALEDDKALEAYTRALDMEPVMPELFFSLGFFYLRKKNFLKARENFSEYLKTAEDPEKKEKSESIIREIESQGLDDHRYAESLDLIRRGREEEALVLVRDFLEEHPKAWHAWFVLGWALRKKERWSDALAAFQKALELGGNTADTRNEMSICLMEQGDFSAAQKELEAALREEPENVKIISNLGILALKKGKPQEAAGFFRAVLELNPQDPLALKFLGTQINA